jgi:Protein of unknown function (DUF4087)
MKRLVIAAALLVASAHSAHAETRCGWVSKSGKSWYLTDKQSVWVMRKTGEPRPPWLDNLPDLNEGGWREPEEGFGYGCGCLQVTVDKASRRVTDIVGGTSVPYSDCEMALDVAPAR